MTDNKQLKILDQFKQVNHDAIFLKLANLHITNNTIKCLDLIHAISTSIQRDIRIINSYKYNEIVLKKLRIKGVVRKCRMFTVAGIARYVQEGHIYSYNNVCEYFDIVPMSAPQKMIKKCKRCDGLYSTARILKLLFGWRKRTRKLCSAESASAIITWINSAGLADQVDMVLYKELQRSAI